MARARPEILAYVRGAGELTITEFRIRKLEDIAAQAAREISDISVNRCCVHVEKYFPNILLKMDLIE